MHDRSPVPAPLAVPACPNCGAHSPGKFCAACGQRAWRGRLTLRGILAQAVADGLNLERGLPGTVVGLTLRPGRTVRAYLSGRTASLTNPVKYLIVFVALVTFITLALGLVERQAELVRPGILEGEHAHVGRTLELMSRYFNLALLFGVPFLALFSRMLFRRAGFNLAEHLVFNAYAYGHQTALFLPFVPAFLLAPAADLPLLLAYALVMMGYYVWASERFFAVGRLRGALLASGVIGLAMSFYWLVIATVVLGATALTG